MSHQGFLPNWQPVDGNSPIRDRLYLVTGKSGYSRFEKFLALAYLRPDDDKDRWRDVTGEELTDQGWVVHHYAEQVILLPDPPETPAERLVRLEQENKNLRQHISLMSKQDQGAGGNVTKEELGDILLDMAKKGTTL